MREQMIKEFCKARNDLDCVGITYPKFVEFLNYFRPKPDNAEYPEEELLDYNSIWNDCPCGCGYNYYAFQFGIYKDLNFKKNNNNKISLLFLIFKVYLSNLI